MMTLLMDLPDSFWLGVLGELGPSDIASLLKAASIGGAGQEEGPASPTTAAPSAPSAPALSRGRVGQFRQQLLKYCFAPSLVNAEACLRGAATWRFLVAPIVHHVVAKAVAAPPQIFAMQVKPRLSNRFPVTLLFGECLKQWFGADAETVTSELARRVNEFLRSAAKDGGAGEPSMVDFVRAERGQLRVCLNSAAIRRLAERLVHSSAAAAAEAAARPSAATAMADAFSELGLSDCEVDEMATSASIRYYMRADFALKAIFPSGCAEEALRLLTEFSLVMARNACATESMRRMGMQVRLRDVERSFLTVFHPYLSMKKYLRAHGGGNGGDGGGWAFAGGEASFSAEEIGAIHFTSRQESMILFSARLQGCGRGDLTEVLECIQDVLKAAQDVFLSETYNDVSQMLKQRLEVKEKERIRRVQVANRFLLQLACCSVERAMVLVGVNARRLERLKSLIGVAPAEDIKGLTVVV